MTATLLYAAAILRVYVQRPASLPEMSASLTSVVRAYQIDKPRFDQGLRFFRVNQFAEARDAFAHADPGKQDATVQFYVAYSYLRQGWGRVYSDDALFTAGRAALERARQVAPNGTITVDVTLTGELPKGAVPDGSVDGTIELERLSDVMYVGRPAFGQERSVAVGDRGRPRAGFGVLPCRVICLGGAEVVRRMASHELQRIP